MPEGRIIASRNPWIPGIALAPGCMNLHIDISSSTCDDVTVR